MIHSVASSGPFLLLLRCDTSFVPENFIIQTNSAAMADEFDVDALLEAPYKVKSEGDGGEVNVLKLYIW